MSNKQLGNEFERALAVSLSGYGFWAHLMRQDSQGQPFDLIAARNGKTYPIDCKVCEKNVFRLSRVEENQYSAMLLWKDTGNGEGWFALRLNDGSVYMLSFSFIQNRLLTDHVLGEQQIRHFGLALAEWVRQCE